MNWWLPLQPQSLSVAVVRAVIPIKSRSDQRRPEGSGRRDSIDQTRPLKIGELLEHERPGQIPRSAAAEAARVERA